MKLEFDPNQKSNSKSGIYGLPHNEHQAKVLYLSIPWDVTTSYKSGASKGPKAILKASEQIDLFDLEYGKVYEAGFFMKKAPRWLEQLNKSTRLLCEEIISAPEDKVKKSKKLQKILDKVNQASDKVNQFVYEQTKQILSNNQISILVGGDHSTPFGAIKAYAEKYPKMGILHFDAHSDTRKAYMSLNHSHASIMYNVSEEIKSIKSITQVGIRDFCEEEFNYTKKSKKFDVYFDLDIQQKKINGVKFSTITQSIIKKLPKEVYISFDIDGLDPVYCPNTGTPVPGGLSFSEVTFIINQIVKSGRKIVGLDLVEVAPSSQKNNDWDANLGMRLLYKLTCACLFSQKKN